MGRAEAKSGQAAKRPMAETSGASLPRDVSVLSIVADLEGRDLDGLRRQWRAHLGGEAPAHLPRWLLMRVLAHRLQSDAFGALDKRIRRHLRCEKDDGAGVPFDRRAPQTRQGVALKAGALLVREWKGRLERVTMLRLEWPDFWQPIPDRQGDHGDQLERPSLLRASAGKSRRCGSRKGPPKGRGERRREESA